MSQAQAMKEAPPGMNEAPLLEIVSLIKAYRLPRASLFAPHGRRPALAGVSFSIFAGHSFGIVGESGSGKSTLARIALALDRPDSGAVRLEGRPLFEIRAQRIARSPRPYADDLPGPLRFARPPPAR